jgi:hypothetical protein
MRSMPSPSTRNGRRCSTRIAAEPAAVLREGNVIARGMMRSWTICARYRRTAEHSWSA